MIRRVDAAANHLLELPLLDLELPAELRIWRAAARNPARMFLTMVPASVPIFTLIHSVLLIEIWVKIVIR